MKKILAVIVAFVLALGLVVPFTVSAGAASGTTGDCTWTLDDNGVLTISGNGAMADYDDWGPWGIDITEIIIEDGVTYIGAYAFAECGGLRSVTIGNGVTTIGRSAFDACAITSVTIPNSVTNIGAGAFECCFSLTSVYITDMTAWCNIDFGDKFANPLWYDADLYLNNNRVTKLGIPKGVTAIKDNAFYGCGSITSVTIPDSVTSIGFYAFSECTSLTSVTIGNGVTSIGSSAFKFCYSLTSVTIPDSVTSIGDYAFSYTGLTSVTIGNGVTSIGTLAFADCYSLTSVTIPDSVTSIGERAFETCSSLTSVTIGNGVTSIGTLAFQDCTSLTSVTIPDSVTSIGEGAFSCCDSLTSVTIPYTVQSIGQWAFESDTDLIVHEDSAGHTYALANSNPYTLTEHTPAGEGVVVPATCLKSGTESNSCSVCEKDYVTVLPMLAHNIVDGLCTVCGLPDLQSDHPYADNLDQTWTHTVDGAGIISVTFSEETFVEENIDYIYLYDGQDKELGYYTGAQLAGQTVTVSGNTIKIRLVSDSSTNGFGFQVTSITSSPAIEQTTDGVIQLLKHIDGHDVGLDDAVADINGDGDVTVFDAVRLLQLIAEQ